ncbi:MAG: ABC transporter, partial [Clostridia bacterium]|nr:ABC transporter [Clostridia bacterium]
TTSEKAYSSVNIEEKQSSEKEEGDIEVDGTFKLGAAVSLNEGRIVYYSNSKFMETNVNQSVSGANSILFIDSLNWLCEAPDSVNIPSKSVSYDVLTINSRIASVLKTVMVGVLPALFILAGIAVIILRKKR